jgi:hypothetical protein
VRSFHLWPILLVVSGAPSLAQPQYSPPRGSYERHCTDIRMNGQFLSATCQGLQGGGQSSINILSCGTEISVDASGALSCLAPGVARQPASPLPSPPAYSPAQPYDQRSPYRGQGRENRYLNQGGRFSGYPQFKGLEAHIRSQIVEGVSDDLIQRDDARDLLGQLRAIQTQEAREYRVHGWDLPDQDQIRLRDQLEQLDRLVDQTREEQ